MAEVSSINAKSIVDTAVTQFKTAIQEALTSEVARVQRILGELERAIADGQKKFTETEAAQQAADQRLAKTQAANRDAETRLEAELAQRQTLKAEIQALERAHAAARAAYHQVPA